MKLTIDSDEPLEDVLKVVGAMYKVELSTSAGPAGRSAADDPDEDGGWRTKTRHL